MDHRIPVTLLTGFLGSGKTTLLNRLLHHPGMKNTAVIINELGVAGLDHILARTVEDDHVADSTVLLSSGCLCCSLRGELAATMRDLYFKRTLMAIPEFDRLVIETTGMADPGPILAHLLHESVIQDNYRLDAVVVTIDAVYGPQQIEDHAEARKQAAVADVLLVTKTDLTDHAQLTALTEKLAQINPGAAQYPVLHGEIDPTSVIDVGLFDAVGKEPQPLRWLRASGTSKSGRGTLPQKVHDDGISNFTVAMVKPLLWQQLESVLKWLCQTYGEQLLRMKGIIHAEDQAAPLAVHAVHHTLYSPTLLTGWDEDEPVSRIVFIGKGLDETAIRDALMQI